MRSRIRHGAVAAAVLLAWPTAARAQGLYLPGGGAAHLSMGGASTATPVDAIGALYWNPAAVGRLGRSEVSVGGGVLFPDINLDSSNGRRSGSTRSDSDASLLSSLGVVYQPDDSRTAFGLGLTTLGGGGVNFPGDLGNPILAGVGPLGNVQGPIYSNLALLQVTPTVAYRVTDRLVFGAGPTVSVAATSFDPAYFGAPDDANGDGIGTFPTATHSRPFWGGGFRAGLVYSATDRLDVGFGYTSPQWFERWKYNARDELGRPRTLFLTATLPAVYSLGAGYRATDRLLLAADVRFFDYGSTDLFGTRVRDGGLGWKGVFAAAVGARYQATDRAALSLGYVYNDNPIPSIGTLFNVQGPAITQHTAAAGVTVQLTDAISASAGYALGFRNSLAGPVREATGVGTRFDIETQQVTFTMQYRFGGGRGRKPVTRVEPDCPPVTDPAGSPTAAAPADTGRAATLPGQRAGG
jgi:long-chain fatty acid transport protein